MASFGNAADKAERNAGGGGVIAAVCTGHDYTQPGKPRIDWTDPDAKQALVSALVTDANAVLAALKGRGTDAHAGTMLLEVPDAAPP